MQDPSQPPFNLQVQEQTTLDPQHFEEWRSSGVDDAIIKLNVRSLSGHSAHAHLIYSAFVPRRNGGRIRNRVLYRYQHLEQGGWWVDGLDPLAGWEPMLWGCFKPDKPKHSAKCGKFIKYEHPYRTPTRAFFLRVSLHIWQRISDRYQVPMPKTVEITPDGEALGFWQWVLDNKQIPITVVEGVKKAGCLLSAGEVAIALPGVSMGFRSPKDEMGNPIGNSYLIPELTPFATPGRKINICFDQDSKPKTIATVRTMIAKMGGLFDRSGCIVRVVEWDSKLGKGVDDLIVNHGAEAFYTALGQAMLLEKWQARQYFNLTYTPNLLVNRRYLGELEIPSDAKLIAVKSLKGTGKTQSLGDIAQEAAYRGQKVLVLTHRTQLGIELCSRFGIDYISELRDSETQGLLGYGLCIDSLHLKSQARFNAEEWKNCLIIIDEVEQVLGHLLNSSTCTSERVSILKSLKTLIQQNLSSESDGRVLLADADLSDVSIDYIKALAGFSVEPFVILNDWKPEDGGWICHQYSGKNPSELWASLESDIREGGKPFVCLSAQKEKSKWGTINLEAKLRTRFPDLRILRIDAETVADPDHAAYQCIGNLNEILPMYDCVLASPSIETGVSIVLEGHFTGVWGIFQGVTAPNSALQALARVREAVPRHFWAAERGMTGCFIGNGSTSIKSLLSCQHKTTKSNISLLQRADLEAITDVDTNFQNESLVTWAKLAVRHNVAMWNYRESIVTGLRDEGH
ncbi:MAG: plasmid replication protein, CyRepA1 family, partial [Cyanobacteriota bacterium]